MLILRYLQVVCWRILTSVDSREVNEELMTRNTACQMPTVDRMLRRFTYKLVYQNAIESQGKLGVGAKLPSYVP